MATIKKKSTGSKPGGTGTQRATQERDAAGKAIKGSKIAEKWNEKTVIPILNKMYEIIAKDEDTEQAGENPVRANSIKLQKEICLMVGISGKTYCEWKEKFCYKKRRNYTTDEMEDNPTYSDAISELIEKISDICECRLQYSGLAMDMFILKNHYGFRDTFEHDLTSKGEQIKTTAPVVTIIEQH